MVSCHTLLVLLCVLLSPLVQAQEACRKCNDEYTACRDENCSSFFDSSDACIACTTDALIPCLEGCSDAFDDNGLDDSGAGNGGEGSNSTDSGTLTGGGGDDNPGTLAAADNGCATKCIDEYSTCVIDACTSGYSATCGASCEDAINSCYDSCGSQGNPDTVDTADGNEASNGFVGVGGMGVGSMGAALISTSLLIPLLS
jgi:hypothetical protein